MCPYLYQDSKDQKTYFLKIHAPLDVLATYADVLKIKVPFKESDIPHGQDVPLEWLSHPFRLPQDIVHPQRDYFTYPFDKTKTDFFLINDKDTFFPPSTRNRIVSISYLKSQFTCYIVSIGSKKLVFMNNKSCYNLTKLNSHNLSGQTDPERLPQDVCLF